MPSERTDRHTLDLHQRVICRGVQTANFGEVVEHVPEGYRVRWDENVDDTQEIVTFSEIRRKVVEAVE